MAVVAKVPRLSDQVKDTGAVPEAKLEIAADQSGGATDVFLSAARELHGAMQALAESRGGRSQDTRFIASSDLLATIT